MARNYDEVVTTGDEDDVRGAGYRPEPYWSLKAVGDSSVLRFLAETPDWVKGATHQFVPVSLPQPEGHEGKWPNFMSATCRKDENLSRFYPDGCPICADTSKDKWGKTFADKVQPLRYALAVEREIITDEKTNTKSVVDKTVKIPARWGEDGKPVEGETVEAPSLVIVAETMWRLFSQFKTMAADYGSMRGMDFTIKRIADPAKPDRSLLQVLPVVIPAQITQEHWDIYANTVAAWVPGGLRLKQIVGEKSEEDYYDRFWTRNGVMVPKGSGGSGGGSAQPSAPIQAADPDKLKAMRDRIAAQAAPASA